MQPIQHLALAQWVLARRTSYIESEDSLAAHLSLTVVAVAVAANLNAV